MGSRSFSVSPNFAQTRSAPLLSLGRLCNSARLAGSELFGGKINEPFPGKTDYRYQCRLGCRTFSVSPNFAQTRSAPILGLSRHDKTMPTQTRKRCTAGFEQSEVIRKMFYSPTYTDICDRLFRGSVRSFCRQKSTYRSNRLDILIVS